MDSKKPLYKYKTVWVLCLFLLYSALGFFAVPYFLKKEITNIVHHELNSQIKIEKVKFNPYTISSDIINVKITDKDSTLWLNAENIHVNVNLWNTLINHLSFDKIHLTNPHYYLYVDDRESFQIKYPKIKPNETNNESQDPLLLDIGLIGISQGAINYNNQSTEKQVDLNLRKIVFHHDSFTTLDNNNFFSLSFATINDEKAVIDGSFNVLKSSFNVNWSINDLKTDTVFHLIGDAEDSLSGIISDSGFINASGTVTSAEAGLLPKIDVSRLDLIDFSNKVAAENQLKFSIPSLSSNKINIDLDNQNISIDNINSEQANLSISFEEDYSPILFDKMKSKEAEGINNQWNYLINSITANNTDINLNKLKDNKFKNNELSIETLSIQNLTNAENQTAEIIVESVIDSQGRLKLVSKLNQNPFELNNNLMLNDLSLNKWQAWVPNDILIQINSGLMALEQNIEYKNDNYISKGWFKFNELSLSDIDNQPFFNINQLDLKSTSLDSIQKKISFDSIVLDKAEGELVVSKEKQLNINNIVPSSTTEQGQEPAQSDDWIIEINQVELIEAQTSLTDKSIDPNYHTEISQLNGIIKGLSSENLSRADLSLSGLLDTYGKLNVNGQINPLSDTAFTDISVNIENLNLQNFSSYSGQFLGFPITRGKVDFELKYKLNQSLLKGINDLTFKQLQFGEKTASKDAVNLPLKLAVGLLTDSKGIMQINLPVSGNIDDPEFSYGGLVFKAFFKLITGIVASPFKLLGKLIPGGADLDLSGIQFQAGLVELQPEEAEKLVAMKKILKQRPGILLELSGVINTINDTKALKLMQLLSQLDMAEKPRFTSDFDIDPIKKLFHKVIGESQWQQLTFNATKDNVLNIEMLANNAWNELLDSQQIGDKLNLLAKDRALFIQSELIENHEVAEDKIYIKPSEMSETLYPQVKFGVGQ